MRDGARTLQGLAPGDHAAVFYDDERALHRFLADHLAAGAKRGEAPAILSAEPQRVLRGLSGAGYPAQTLRRRGELLVLDAEPVVARLLDGEEGAVADTLRKLSPPPGHRGVRVAGSLAEHLWRAGLTRRAVAVEQATPPRLDCDATLLCTHDARLLSPGRAWDAFMAIAHAHRAVFYVGGEEGAVELQPARRTEAAPVA